MREVRARGRNSDSRRPTAARFGVFLTDAHLTGVTRVTIITSGE